MGSPMLMDPQPHPKGGLHQTVFQLYKKVFESTLGSGVCFRNWYCQTYFAKKACGEFKALLGNGRHHFNCHSVRGTVNQNCNQAVLNQPDDSNAFCTFPSVCCSKCTNVCTFPDGTNYRALKCTKEAFMLQFLNGPIPASFWIIFALFTSQFRYNLMFCLGFEPGGRRMVGADGSIEQWRLPILCYILSAKSTIS